MPASDIFPRQAGTTLAFGATVGGWAWSQIAVDWRLAGGGFFAEQSTRQKPGVIAFPGPSLRYGPVPALWLVAGAGVTGACWNEEMRTTGALRPGFDLRACYWFKGAFQRLALRASGSSTMRHAWADSRCSWEPDCTERVWNIRGTRAMEKEEEEEDDEHHGVRGPAHGCAPS